MLPSGGSGGLTGSSVYPPLASGRTVRQPAAGSHRYSSSVIPSRRLRISAVQRNSRLLCTRARMVGSVIRALCVVASSGSAGYASSEDSRCPAGAGWRGRPVEGRTHDTVVVIVPELLDGLGS